MAKVYISSTRVDLDDERDRVLLDLVDANHQPRHSYGASSEPLVETCLSDVDESDIYVLLLGRRYGHRPALNNPERLSITHLEFRRAVERRMPLVVLEQRNPPMHLSDADEGRDEDEASRKSFWAEVRGRVVPGVFDDEASLTRTVLNGVHEAARRLEDERIRDAPAITPGVSPPHGRALSHALLVIHMAGRDDLLAGRLAAALRGPEIGWAVKQWRWNVEGEINWRELDQSLASCRAVAVLLTDSISRFDAQAVALREMLAFAQRQCGYAAGFVVGDAAARMASLPTLPLSQVHRIDAWAATNTGAITTDFAAAKHAMSMMHPDLEETKLVGLQCIVVAMTRDEATALRDDPQIRDSLNGEQRRFLDGALETLADTNWPERYGALREDWQPFGFRDGTPLPALSVLREVIDDINAQEVVPRRDQEALRGHRIRLRHYLFQPLVAEDSRATKLMAQVMARRVLVLVDELSLCHPQVRAAAADTLADPLLAVATLSPFDPPLQSVDSALSGNGVLKLGALTNRFLRAMDPTCELNLASRTRLRRWLRVSIPEILIGGSGNALEERRQQFRRQAGAGL